MSHLSTSSQFVPFLITSVWLVSCFSNENHHCDEGFRYDTKTSDCLKISLDKPSNSGDERIGSACHCEGERCRIVGIPTGFLGTIVGCDDVPQNWSGAVLSCMQSYEGDNFFHMYYAQGFCTLLSIGCSGDEMLCNGSTAGDYKAMTSCPENTVMLTTERKISSQGLVGVFNLKYCIPTCERDSDCRTDAFDETLDEPGQYQCIDKNDVKFCYDPRNLTDDDLIEAF